nr:DNA gyrase inhibitor YacG [uncultured Moraxella sp.]
MTTETIQQYPCPHCKKLTAWQNNPFKPFCSERCKLIDLGAWANEDYKLPTNDTPFSNDMNKESFD